MLHFTFHSLPNTLRLHCYPCYPDFCLFLQGLFLLDCSVHLALESIGLIPSYGCHGNKQWWGLSWREWASLWNTIHHPPVKIPWGCQGKGLSSDTFGRVLSGDRGVSAWIGLHCYYLLLYIIRNSYSKFQGLILFWSLPWHEIGQCVNSFYHSAVCITQFHVWHLAIIAMWLQKILLSGPLWKLSDSQTTTWWIICSQMSSKESRLPQSMWPSLLPWQPCTGSSLYS